jgi:putative ABC transport system permease protein
MDRQPFAGLPLRRVRALPGVRAAAIASRVDVLQRADMTIQGANEPLAGSRGRSISPDYLRLMGIPLLAGRDFHGRDTTTSPKVMLVNQTFARRFFPDRNPVGQRAVYGDNDCEIVGVVGDVRGHLQHAGANAEFYIPLAQGPRGTARLLVRSTAPLSAVRHEVEAIDPDQAVAEMRLLNDALDDTLSQPRSTMSILIAFASAAMLLAVLGVYGVMAYGVAQRTREIAIRMALGAKTTDVRNLILGQSLRLVLAGIAIGLPLAIAAGGLYSTLLFGVQPADLRTIAGVITLLSLAAMVAAYIPARRAARVDPAFALRSE